MDKSIFLNEDDRDWMTALYAKLDMAQRLLDEEGKHKTVQSIIGEAKGFVSHIKNEMDGQPDLEDYKADQ